MHIGYIGPISLQLLKDLVDSSADLPLGFQYPFGAYLVREYIRQGHQVSVITNSADVLTTTFYYGKNLTIALTPRRRHLLYCIDGYRKECAYMVEAIRVLEPDVLHAQWTYEFAYAALSTKIPTLVTVRDAPWTIAKTIKTPYRFYRAFYSKRVFNKVTYLSGISDYIIQKIKTEFPITSKIDLIPNGISDLAIHKCKKSDSEPGEVRFISVTGWDSRKNTKTLLRAFDQVIKKYPKWRLEIIGHNMEKNGLANQWASNNNINKNISFCGYKKHPDVLDQLSINDIFVYSSLEESFCNVVLEAMAVGLPVVALPDSGAVPWLLDYGECGLLSKNQSYNSLADAMILLGTNTDLQLKFSKCAKQRVEDMFTLSRVASIYTQKLSSICN